MRFVQHAITREECTAAEYRERAQAARARALQTGDYLVRKSLLQIAETLDRLALTQERVALGRFSRGAELESRI
jgi:hypothetical protein